MEKKNNQAETAPDHPDRHLRDRTYSVAAQEIAGALREIAGQRRRWRFTGYDPGTGTARMEHDTPIITFTDDITLRLAESGGRTTVSGRSQARMGSYDFGVNARNLRTILKELDKRFAG